MPLVFRMKQLTNERMSVSVLTSLSGFQCIDLEKSMVLKLLTFQPLSVKR